MTNCVQLLLAGDPSLRMQKHVDDKPSIKPKIYFGKTMYFVLKNGEIMFDFECFASLILSSVC